MTFPTIEWPIKSLKIYLNMNGAFNLGGTFSAKCKLLQPFCIVLYEQFLPKGMPEIILSKIRQYGQRFQIKIHLISYSKQMQWNFWSNMNSPVTQGLNSQHLTHDHAQLMEGMRPKVSPLQVDNLQSYSMRLQCFNSVALLFILDNCSLC